MRRKKVTVTRDICVNRYDDAMTITLENPNAKTTRYYLDGYKGTKGNCEVSIMTYLYWIVEGELPNAVVYLDERLTNEFKAITETPYFGEFKLIYTDADGKPIRTAPLAASKEHYNPDTTPYHVEISMFGNKTAVFEIRCNGKLVLVDRAQKANDWLIRLYQRRHCYANLSISVSRMVADWLDVLAVNPRRIFRELNVTLTDEQSRVADTVA